MWHPVSPATALRRLPSGGSRTISTTVLSTRLVLEPLQLEHVEHWQTSIEPLLVGAGDVANLGDVDRQFCPPGFIVALRACMLDWGIPPGPEHPVALVCQGSGFHHDADSHANQGFCVLWLSEDQGWDLVFPLSGDRIALEYGTVVLFDSGHLHGVLMRGDTQYAAEGFVDACAGFFLSQDFPLHAQARRRLGVEKLSRLGRGNRTLLGADNIQEDVDMETGRWSARDLRHRN